MEARRDAERAVKVAPTNENAISVLAALALRAGENDRDLIIRRPSRQVSRLLELTGANLKVS